MRKFIVSLLMLVMVWTVVDRYFSAYDTSRSMFYVLENENNTRKLIMTDDYRKNLIIVGDKVTISYDRWGTETLQRVK